MGSGDVARITIVSADYVQEASANGFAPPAEKGGFLRLDVLWETTAGETAANPLYFTARDAEGRGGDVYIFGDDQLASGEVFPGDKARGYVYFDIAKGPTTIAINDPIFRTKARIVVTPP